MRIDPELLAAADPSCSGPVTVGHPDDGRVFAADDTYARDESLPHQALANAMDTLWMAYQPIVHWPSGKIFASEALVRTDEPSLPCPPVLLEAAARLGLRGELGRAIRASIAATGGSAPGPGTIFANVDPEDLLDGALYEPDQPLSRLAPHVVIELTERTALYEVADVRARVTALRGLGYRIAVDDLGAGYAGLSTISLIEPEVVKLDQALTRGVQGSAIQRQIIRSVAALCRDLGILLVAEGVETEAEREVLVDLGCELLQGHLLAPPTRSASATRPLASAAP